MTIDGAAKIDRAQSFIPYGQRLLGYRTVKGAK